MPQTGDQDKHQGCRHLTNHEEIPQAEPAVAAQGRLRALFQGAPYVGANRRHRGCQAETNARNHSNGQCPPQRLQIEMGM